MKTFKKTFQFICDECGEYAHTLTDYCEKCGTQSLRKATKEDYLKYEEVTTKEAKKTRKITEEAHRVKKAKQAADLADKKAEKKTEKKAEKKVEKDAKRAEKEAEKTKKKAEEE